MVKQLTDNTNNKQYGEFITAYLTHSFIPLPPSTDIGVGDVKVPPMHLSTPVITDNGQVHGLQHVIMASA